MAFEINLLPDKKKDLSPEVELGLGKARKAAVVILFLVLVIAAGTFAYGQAILAQKNSLETKIQNLETLITSYKEKEIVLVLLKNKVAGIKTVLDVRPDVSKEMSKINTLLPQDTEISSFKVDKTGIYSIEFIVKNSAVLDTLVEAFKKSSYKNVGINSLSGNVKDGYKFSLDFKI
ncbi:MAG: hypothetical protein Q7S14_02860 [bacterium]|nr:hypothetical protein [bacterium]